MIKSRTIDSVKVAFTDSGEGSPVVLLHGWGCNHTTLASVERVALTAGRRVINIDFPGFGDSQEPPEPWDVEQYTRNLENLLKAEGIENPVMLGHSFGGRVAIIYASRNPVEKLILVDAAGVKPRRSLKYYYKVYSFKAMRRILELTFGKDKARSIIDRRRAKSGSADYAAASPMMRAVMSRVVNEDLCRYMPLIKAPTLLIWGEDDTATPLRDAKKMERLIPGSGLVSFPGCGHYSFLDNAGQFAAVLQSFLKS